MKVNYTMPPQESMNERGEIITTTKYKMEDMNSEDVQEVLEELEQLGMDITVTISLKPLKE